MHSHCAAYCDHSDLTGLQPTLQASVRILHVIGLRCDICAVLAAVFLAIYRRGLRR